MASFNHRVLPSTVYENSWRGVSSRCDHGRYPNYCGAPVEFVCSYEYVTGRSGRVTDRRFYRCRAHAEAFADRWGIPVNG